ncbi:MAG: 3-isopropylmalate dehydratase large subunit [Methanosarcinaceae archaeon]|nr:3-isopropylmalate dehydratase large subunit [Methanosarcinaceae archaeon]
MTTITEKILSRASNKTVKPKEFVIANIDYAMAHDGTSVLTVKGLKEMGFKKVWNPDKIVIPFDHYAPANTERTAILHKEIRDWAKEQNIKNFYDVGEGVCHQVFIENGFALPGSLIVGADSHSCTYGAFGAFGTGVGATDMAEVFATGKLWFRVPETIKITSKGKLKTRVYAKDLMLKMIGVVGADGGTNKAVEFYGDTIERLSMSERMVLSNMAIEMGADAGIITPDDKTYKYLENRAKEYYEPAFAEENATYSDEFYIDAKNLKPQIACPYKVDNVKDVLEIEGIRIHQVVIGTCTNGRLEDIEVAASILKGETVAVRTIIAPASRTILIDAIKSGAAEILLEAGATFITPGCGPCLGGHMGVIGKGEICLTTANRNFRGRMGTDGLVYLSSPATAAISAIMGEITDPTEM